MPRVPLTINLSRPRTPLVKFHIGDKVCFERSVDRRDQVEHPDPLPVINAGSLGTILENDGKSVLVGVIKGPDKKVVTTVRLYDTDPKDDDCSTAAIRHLQYLSRDGRCLLRAPETTGFQGRPDPYLDNPPPERVRTIRDIWPDEHIPSHDED